MGIWMQIIRNCALVPSSELIEPAERLQTVAARCTMVVVTRPNDEA
jgi:hypothetical protein